MSRIILCFFQSIFVPPLHNQAGTKFAVFKNRATTNSYYLVPHSGGPYHLVPLGTAYHLGGTIHKFKKGCMYESANT